jgi:hypothetical protein
LQKATNDLAKMKAIRDCAEMLEPLGDNDAIYELKGMGHVAGISDDTMSAIVEQGLEIARQKRARHKHNGGIGQGPEGTLHEGEALAEEPKPDLGEVDVGTDIGPPGPREWLHSNQFCRKFLSGLVAPGATGKSALRYVQAIEMALGRSLTGAHIFRQSRVLLVSLEDDADEMMRRLEAPIIHHKVDRNHLRGWLFRAAPRKLKLAEMVGGSRQIGKLERVLRDAIERRNIDMLMLDPFVKLHALEENDNGAMDFVCDLLTQLAIEYNIGVDAPHHAKKGTLTPGDADSGRGGSAIRDAGRLVYTLSGMAEDESRTFGIKELERRAYIRLDNAKVNLVTKASDAKWFKLIGVRLENGNLEYPNGDEVQTVISWKPPDTWADISTDALNAALTEIDAGLPEGRRYSSASGAKARAAWPVVQRHCPDKTEPQCRQIINTWLKSGLLYNKEYNDPVDRKDVEGLHVDNTKRPR